MPEGYFEKDIKYFEKKGSFQRKFGIKVASAGVVVLPLVIFFIKKLKLKYSDFFLIAYIFSKKFDLGWPFFSLAKVTRELGVCQDTLHRSKNRMIKLGYLKTRMRRENRKGKGRLEFDLSGLFEALEVFIDENKPELLKFNQLSGDDMLDYAFLKDYEKEALSENQRLEKSKSGDDNKV